MRRGQCGAAEGHTVLDAIARGGPTDSHRRGADDGGVDGGVGCPVVVAVEAHGFRIWPDGGGGARVSRLLLIITQIIYT